MFSSNARKTTFLFICIILVGVFVDLFVSKQSFSSLMGNRDTSSFTADVQKSSWFWKK